MAPSNIPALIREYLKRGVTKKDIPRTLCSEHNVQISLRTLRRIMRRFIGISVIRSSAVALGEREEMLLKFINDDPTGRLGSRHLKVMLGKHAMHVTQSSITEFLHAVNSAGSAAISRGFGMVENMFETIDATEAEFHFDSNPAGSRPNATEDMVADVHESAISRRSLVWVHYTPKDWAYNGEGSGERALWARNRNLGVRQCPRRGERLEKPSLSCSRRRLLLNFVRRVNRRAAAGGKVKLAQRARPSRQAVAFLNSYQGHRIGMED